MENSFLNDIIINKNNLCNYACSDDEAHYFMPYQKDIRGNFYHDIDKILYSLSFSRYIDKTQVFSYAHNNHVSKRILHVLYVSKIARTIGRSLKLNEDLIEAIALGHDLGHVPFGHVGEKILNDISMKNGVGTFNHNIHSVRTLMSIENYGHGLNVSLEVLDGIMCHNGESEVKILQPTKKSKELFLKEYYDSYKDSSLMKKYVAGTLEGNVVRISDMIGYLGRDIDDAIRMNLIKRKDIPKCITDVLGTTTSSIINTIILDVIKNSYNKPYIMISDTVFDAISNLKNFNYEFIYNKANTKEDIERYTNMFNKLFYKYLDDIKNNNDNSLIVSSYLKNMCDEYKNNNSNEAIVVDYLAGMTDEFINNEYNKL